jgi:hypothetical protein
MKKIIFLIGFFLVSSSGYAEPLLESYTARLSSEDHVNSNGERLESAAAIIRQDRANYHKFNIRDSEDQFDSVFADKDNRDRLEAMLKKGFISNATKDSIVNDTPVIFVKIYKNHIEVSLL